jgi:hypothetical protein
MCTSRRSLIAQGQCFAEVHSSTDISLLRNNVLSMISINISAKESVLTMCSIMQVAYTYRKMQQIDIDEPISCSSLTLNVKRTPTRARERIVINKKKHNCVP